jgi:hypothetical protein
MVAELRGYEHGLTAVARRKVAEVAGYVSNEFGDPVFQLTRVIFDDGTSMDVEGEHDCPYICGDPDFQAHVYDIWEEENPEEDEEEEEA